MKIQLSNINLLHNRNIASNNSPHQVPIATAENHKSGLSKIYYSPLNFGCNETEPLKEKLLKLEGVHCPCCGTEILTKENAERLLEGAENIQTTKEFIDFLNERKKHINYIFYSIIDYLDNIVKKSPDIELLYLLNIARSSNIKNIFNMMNKQVEYIDKFVQENNLSEHDLKLINQCKQQILAEKEAENKYISVDCFSNILKENILSMETNKKNDLFTVLRYNASKTIIKRNAFTLNKNDEPESKSIAYTTIKNLIDLSTGLSRHLFKNSSKDFEYLDKYNELLMCKKCFSDDSYNYKLMVNKEKNLKNINRYVTDISEKIINNEIIGYERYPFVISGMLKAKIEGKDDFRKSDLSFQVRQAIFKTSQGTNNDLPLIDNVPCACCGKDTISHNQKTELFEEIAQIKDLHDLMKIFNEKSNIIRPKFMEIVKDFEEELKRNPDISEEDMIEYLKENAANRLEIKLFSCLNKILKDIKKDRLSINDAALVNQFAKEVLERYQNIDPTKDFDYDSYLKLIDTTLGKMEYANKRNYIFKMKKPVHKKAVAYRVLFPAEKTMKKFDSVIKIIGQDIMKGSTLTKDHTIALQKGGPDERKNIMLICKDCNKEKANRNFLGWKAHTPDLDINLQKQFDFFKDKIKSGELDEKFKDYLNEFSEYIYEISDKTIKLK